MIKEVEELMIEYLLLAIQDIDIFPQTRDHYINILFDELAERMYPRKKDQWKEARDQLTISFVIFNRLWDSDPAFHSFCKIASQTIAEMLSVVETERMRLEGRLSQLQPASGETK